MTLVAKRPTEEKQLRSALRTLALRRIASASAAVILLAAATPAHADVCGSAAGNLIVNCGFEGGATTPGGNIPTGWTVNQWNGEEAIYTGSPVNSGDASLRISNDINQGGPLFSGAAILSQSFNDIAGEVYDFNFYLYNGAEGSSTELFQAFEDSTSGSPLFSTDGSNIGGSFTEVSLSFTGTGSDSITFTAYNNPNWFWLDDVEVLDTGVNATPPPSLAATPEPGSLVLVGTGMLGACGAIRRRIRK